MRTVVLTSVLVFAVGLLAGLGPALAEDEEYTLVGVKKCKMCHKKPESGNQFGIWEEGAHAKAFATLATDEAKAEAAKHGIEDPQAAPECLKCHATAASVMADLENQKITLEEGVSCESCHGAGSAYYKKKTMADITAGTLDGATVGLVVPDEKTCLQCHIPEGNAFYKEFKFEERVAKIAHPIPDAAAGTE